MHYFKRVFCAVVMLCLLSAPALADGTSVRMTFTGDVTLGSELRTRSQDSSFFSVAAREGYDYFFRNWTELFSSDDLTVVNLEGPLTDSDREENKTKTYRFNGKTEFVQILLSGSVEAANLANNHTPADFGKQGLESTENTLTSAGIGWFGSEDVWTWDNGTVRIAFIGMNSTGFYNSREWLKERISDLKNDEGVNAVVFVYHGGTEYSNLHTSTQRSAAHYAINAGADLVIMHHPHVVQGMEIYKNRTILYSLGNFCFGGNSSVRELDTVVAGVVMDFDGQGRYSGQQITLYPAHISGTEPASNYQPVRVSGEDAASVIRKMQRDTEAFTFPESAEDGSVVLAYVAAE